MSSTSSVASQPPIPFTPSANNDRAQIAKEKADEVKTDKAAEKAAKVEDVAATASKAQAAKDAGKGQVLDIQA
jgi:hypothetical protein